MYHNAVNPKANNDGSRISYSTVCKLSFSNLQSTAYIILGGSDMWATYVGYKTSIDTMLEKRDIQFESNSHCVW